jgi:hypothetical protein
MADGREAAAAGAGFLSLFKETITERRRFVETLWMALKTLWWFPLLVVGLKSAAWIALKYKSFRDG